jgi:hypothetical protein
LAGPVLTAISCIGREKRLLKIGTISRWRPTPDPDQAADALAVPAPLLTDDGKDSRGMLDVVEQAHRTEAA